MIIKRSSKCWNLTLELSGNDYSVRLCDPGKGFISYSWPAPNRAAAIARFDHLESRLEAQS